MWNFDLLKCDKITLEQILEIPTYSQFQKKNTKIFSSHTIYNQIMLDILNCGIFTIEFESFPSTENFSLIRNLELDMFLFKYIYENIK